MHVLTKNTPRVLTVILICILSLPGLTGCGTFGARSELRDTMEPPRYYPATYLDAVVWGKLFDPVKDSSQILVRIGGACLIILDLPISLVTDTLWLPCDIWDYEPPRPWLDHLFDFTSTNNAVLEPLPAGR